MEGDCARFLHSGGLFCLAHVDRDAPTTTAPQTTMLTSVSMFAPEQYELCEFGNGWKVERFAGTLVKRPSPAAEFRKIEDTKPDTHKPLTFRRDPALPEHERWTGTEPGDNWSIEFNEYIRLGLQLSPVGHLGIFPEQASNWHWLTELGKTLGRDRDPQSLRAINLFAYTGGSTLALAAAGVPVAHVDAAKNICNRARQNAAASGAADKPIRWIAEDVMTFVEREIKRGNRYDIVVADPPSFGRGPKKQQWKLSAELPRLLDAVNVLTGGRPEAILLSCHTEGFNERRLQAELSNSFGMPRNSIQQCPMELRTRTGERLPSGHCVRWSRKDFSA